VKLSVALRGKPVMYPLAHRQGDIEGRSRVAWSVGKGLVGSLTLGFDEAGRPCESAVIQHETYWPENVEYMSEREWRRLGHGRTLGRSLEDAKALRARYGTAFGIRIQHPATGSGIGCVTLHTPRGAPLTEDKVQSALRLCVPVANQLGKALALSRESI
jgi:hypothetical protein